MFVYPGHKTLDFDHEFWTLGCSEAQSGGNWGGSQNTLATVSSVDQNENPSVVGKGRKQEVRVSLSHTVGISLGDSTTLEKAMCAVRVIR